MPELRLHDLLLYETMWYRLEKRLRRDDHFGDPVLYHADGRLTRAGSSVEPKAGLVRVIWASPDVYIAGLIDPFLDLSVTIRPNWLQAGSAGVDHPGFAKLNAAGVLLTTNEAMLPGIGEYVLASVLDHYQDGPARRAIQATRIWKRRPFREVSGTHWLIVGYGGIAREIASRARAFNVHITGVRRSGGSDPTADKIITPDTLSSELGKADVVILSLPLSRATQHCANAAFFAAMKPGAVIVNVGRGGLLDEAALLLALDRGHVGHAILDVVSQEPLPADNPLWGHPKIVVTCHIAGLGDGLIPGSDELFLDNLARYREDRLLRHIVDQSLFDASAHRLA
jgi:phosphoglycerate dehydrogenase-like enzyme